ncbi:hypothetical protein [Kribbella sp. NPDC004875]|uniref:hypothetical protein n=1 Tax=Kribbella sp. NPDC004875 TaxID=3364107 RepID=UPI00367E1456
MIAVGAGVAGLVVLVLIAVFLFVGHRSDTSSAPVGRPNQAAVGGETTGQAKDLTETLTAKGMECSVRFTVAQGGLAGCFSWADQGLTANEVVFQYQSDGTVIGINAKSVARDEKLNVPAAKPLIDATGGAVFTDDRSRVNDALAGIGSTRETTVDGAWGKYKVRDGASGTTLVAAKTGAEPLMIPAIEATTSEATAAEALKQQGFSCGADDEDCSRDFRGGKGKLTVRTTSLGAGGITYLLVSVADTSKDATKAANTEAFSNLIGTSFGIVQGNGTDAVRKWVTDHQDGQSHTAYVGGWRVELQVNYGTPYGAPEVPSYLRMTMWADSLWTTPDQ